MINIRAEVRDITRKIREEVNRIISSLENELEVSRARENTLRQRLSEVEGQQTFVNRAQIQISQLEREASANRMLYESFLNRFKQIYEQDDMQQTDARIIARADVPERPSKPLRGLILSAAMVASLLLGMFVVFLMEMLHNTFRTSADIEKFTGLKSLAMVPKLARPDSKNVVGFIRANLTGVYCEAVRSVLTALQFSGSSGKPVQTIVVTSSCPGEGKSFFALSLANVAALGGKKVLMIDCDFRRPVIAGMLRVRAEQGLSDYLTGRVPLEEVIYHDKSTGVDYCFAVHRSQVPQSLLSSPEMDTFLRIARERYDYIIIDSPPVMAVSDVIVLSPQADHVLYAVRYEKTPRRLVRTALRTFHHTVRTPSSTIMTQVDIARHASYGYGDEGYYYGKYGSYYAPGNTAA
jgi:capsular exopolysaccharide synthesis family protein